MPVEEGLTEQGNQTRTGGPARTGRRNRVRPDGEIVADPGRGLFWGNRGSLLGAAGQPTRRPSTRAWICCVLEFKGWWRVQWQPGRLTELYFLDEATALAAGHRPCGLCRAPDYRRFQQDWAAAVGDGLPSAPEMDRRLQADRRTPEGRQRTFQAAAGDLPDGAFIGLDGEIGLVRQGRWRPWSMAGYGTAQAIAPDLQVEVLTPAVTVQVLTAGYVPVLHPSVERE
ncbi:hypothetical protein [Dactylosporangium salmoneum]|uniref:Ada DNA repair metal-binding domain-containing protein n=1 Tax=Dactylosporangium salmoneum TaxID=53361 RepID=A0ABP5UBK8_9ACTN